MTVPGGHNYPQRSGGGRVLAAPAPSVLIHDYAGRTVTFRTEARTEGGTGEAGLHVLGSMPTGPISLSNLPAAPGRYVRPQ